jgi:DNA polymerase-4
LGAIFKRLCEQVAADLQRKGYEGRTIGIKIRYDNFQSVTRDQSLDSYVADAQRIRQVAGQCLKRVDLSRRIRLLGVRVGSLVKTGTAPALMPAYSGRQLANGARDEPDLLLFPELA